MGKHRVSCRLRFPLPAPRPARVGYTRRMSRWAWLLVLLLATGAAQAQWEIENSGTTADLRGIDNVGGGVAWASGTNGTVLRTEDGGYLWQACSIPPGAEHLDFRGIQAFDANTAIVMSSGKGDLSRLYKTTDGCHTWKLVFTNPDKDGFWDAVQIEPPNGPFEDQHDAIILGDPVGGSFVIEWSNDSGDTWERLRLPSSLPGEGAFAASNSALVADWWDESFWFGTGGPRGLRLFENIQSDDWKPALMPMFDGASSRGIFSIGLKSLGNPIGMVAVGGDYLKPNDKGIAVYSGKRFLHWSAAATPPHGFRSAVAYDAASKTWITVGPNGTDISTDDGRNWRALHPDPAMHESPDADRNWNALSLPFVVGPHGRIGKLNPKALESAPHQ
jgi:photosystem II stability/assembly factor-like uncharacterized protein